MNTGQRIRKARRDKEWTQKELAEKSGVAERTIQSIESGKHEPQQGNRIALFAALDIEGDESEARSHWPVDVQAYVDIYGQWLALLEPQERAGINRLIVQMIVKSRTAD